MLGKAVEKVFEAILKIGGIAIIFIGIAGWVNSQDFTMDDDLKQQLSDVAFLVEYKLRDELDLQLPVLEQARPWPRDLWLNNPE